MELKRSSLGVMAIFAVTVIGLIGFSNHNAYAVNYDITDATSCATLPNFQDWGALPNMCRISGAPLILHSGDSLTIEDGIVLENDDDIINNAGATITVNSGGTLQQGHIHNFGTIENSGIISVESHMITNNFIIKNHGSIQINAEASLINNPAGTITNFADGSISNHQNINNNGTITNTGTIDNNFGATIDNNFGGGTINNNPGGTITNNGIIANTSGISNSGEFDNFGEFDNYGTVANYETLYNAGTINNNNPSYIINYGTINNNGSTINNSGTIENKSGGKIFNTGLDGGSGFIVNNPTGVINNYGLISNDFVGGTANITNNGSFTNFCGSEFTNSVDATTDGSNPINTLCIVFDHATYPVGGTAIITVNSTAANTNPSTVQIISGNINSTSDIPGIPFNATETGVNTGIFVSIPSITLTSDSSTGSFLHVAPGNSIYATFGGAAGRGTATITAPVAPTITLSVDNHSPKWGVDTVTASGTTTNANPTDKISIDWGDSTPPTIVNPATASWGSQTHVYASTATSTNPHQVIASLLDSGSILRVASTAVPVTVQPHTTSLTVSAHSLFYELYGFSAIGTLTDNDLSNVGIDGKTIQFTGTGSFGLLAVQTNPITFSDPLTLTTSIDGGINVLNVHANTIITTPLNPPAAVLTFKNLAAGTLKVAVTFAGSGTPNPDIITTTSLGGSDVTVNMIYPTGIQSIKILQIPSATAEISSLQTQDVNLATVQDVHFVVPTTPTILLTTNSGAYSSTGTLGTQSSSLTLNANFAGDSSYLTSSASTTYAIFQSNAGGLGDTVTILGDTNKGFISASTCAGGLTKAGPSGDYICAEWKTTGIPIGTTLVNGLQPYYKLNTPHAGTKDVYVEIDYMQGHKPNSTALSDVQTKFLAHGINLHIFTDEVLTHVASLNIWKDNDLVNTNDFDSIKNAHFGNTTEHPVLTMTGTPSISAPTCTTTCQSTITVTGIQIKTPTSPQTSGYTNGQIVLNVEMTLPTLVTVTPVAITTPIPISPPAGFTLGTPTQVVNPKAGTTNTKVVTVTIPFKSTAPTASPVNLGTISVNETFAASPGAVSVVRSAGSPTVYTDLLTAKAQVFHYFVWAHSMGACGPSGQSEMPGNDGVVALGCNFDSSALEFPGTASTDAAGKLQTVGTRTEQAGTFMHELGHQLGLNHGGPVTLLAGGSPADSPINCKPNYPSVMSYSRQFATYLGPNWSLDYSSGTLGPLDETHLQEYQGIIGTPVIVWNTLIRDASGNTFRTAPANSPTLDWDGSGTITPSTSLPNTVSADINNYGNFGITGCSVSLPEGTASYPYKDYSDWDNLNFNLRAGLLNNFDGIGPAVHAAAPVEPKGSDVQNQLLSSSKFKPLLPPTSFELHWFTGVPLPLTFQLFESDGKTLITTATDHAEYTTDGIHFTRIAPDFKFQKSILGQFYLTTWKTTTNQFPKETHVGINYVIDVPGANPNFKVLIDPAHKMFIGTHQVTLKIEFEK